MRRLIFSFLLILPFFLSAQFAIVDRQAILNSMEDYQIAEQQINELSEKYHAEYNRMSADIDKKYEDYQALNNARNTPQSIRERRIQEIQDMQKRAQQFLATAEDELIHRHNELLAPVKLKVDEAIRTIGVERSYIFILPADQPLFSGIQVDDITDLVRERIATL